MNMKFELNNLVRDNIKNLMPYASARHEFTGNASVFLDANENAYGSPLPSPAGVPCKGTSVAQPGVRFNRYPDPLQWQLKLQLSEIKGVPAGNICIGNGSDEIIDLAYRIFCNPGKDNVIICPPTYGMYAVNAAINDVEVRKVDLTAAFQLDMEGIMQATDSHTKLLFICSPNNPTGNQMNRADVLWLLNNFPGIVILDEAYVNYSKQESFIAELTQYPGLVVMQTLSKAWGLAALRLGLCFASPDIIALFNKVKPPYNINQASQQAAMEALKNAGQVNEWIAAVAKQKDLLVNEVSRLSFVQTVYPSDANFILIKVDDAEQLYQYLASNEIVVRNRSNEVNCRNCLRISIGTPRENEILLTALKQYKK
jgi:histidinol-phosphate aminotransferase